MTKRPIIHPNVDSSMINSRTVAVSIILYKEELSKWMIEYNHGKISLEIFTTKRQEIEQVVSDLFDVAKENKIDRMVLRYLVMDYEGFVDLGWLTKEDLCNMKDK